MIREKASAGREMAHIDEIELSLADLCRASRLSAEQVLELIDEGVIDPVPSSRTEDRRVPRFSVFSLRRVRRAAHLRSDLGVNWAGAALVLDLLEEMERLRARLRRFDRFDDR